LLALSLVTVAAGASAQAPGSTNGKQIRAASPAANHGAKASPKERGQLTRQFVTKWGAYVQRIHGVPVGVWAERMVPNFVNSDAANFRKALTRDTFEGAMAELNGTGHRLGDEEIITSLASPGVSTDGSKPRIVARELGSLSNDLVYTPLQPCRIVDTRLTAAGTIAASATRSFIAITSGNYSGQGGSATNCGTSGLSATAFAMNVTAVGYAGTGHATVYPFGTALPTAASVNYNAGSFATNNGVIARIPHPLSSFDFTVWTAQTSHYVIDIVGYFAPPVATALQCVETDNTNLPIAANGGTGNAVAPACAAGYTQTSTNCETTSWLMPIVFFQSGTCSARNGDTSSQTLRASRTCCRVPGR
jgi:hypothetical protein